MNIEDYLPFYMGCECMYLDTGPWTLFGVYQYGYVELLRFGKIQKVRAKDVRPILRSLHDLTQVERTRVHAPAATGYPQWFGPKSFRYLLKHKVDLFGLIKEGLAIDEKQRV
jgi:hypothetical protein